jgi:hypothetical protein
MSRPCASLIGGLLSSSTTLIQGREQGREHGQALHQLSCAVQELHALVVVPGRGGDQLLLTTEDCTQIWGLCSSLWVSDVRVRHAPCMLCHACALDGVACLLA